MEKIQKSLQNLGNENNVLINKYIQTSFGYDDCACEYCQRLYDLFKVNSTEVIKYIQKLFGLN